MDNDHHDERLFLGLEALHTHSKVSIATLATAIENIGICGWDRFGRFQKFKKDSPQAIQALSFLAAQYAWESNEDNIQANEQAPMDLAWDGPLMGWFDDDLPDFKAIEKKRRHDPPAPTKSKRQMVNDLAIVGVMLQVLLPKAGFKSEAEFIRHLLDNGYDDYEGISARNLQKKFAEAKISMLPK